MMLQKPIFKPLLLVAMLGALLPALAHAFPDEKHDRCEKLSPMGHDDRRHGGDMGDGASLPPFLHTLDLSEAQRDEIFSIMHAQAPVLWAKTKVLYKARDGFRVLARSGQYNETRARELAESLADATAALALLRAQDEQRIYALLTPEQRKQLEKNQNKPEFQPMHGAGSMSGKPT